MRALFKVFCIDVTLCCRHFSSHNWASEFNNIKKIKFIGIDNSEEQIKLARKNCPGGDFFVSDITQLKEKEYQVEAVVSFYTIFHTTRETQAKTFQIIASYLKKGGMLLVTMGDREFEGTHTLHGEPMWSSQYGTARNHKMVEVAGFKILTDEIDLSGGERHQVMLAQKL